MDQETREKWDYELTAPLPWEKTRKPSETQAEAEGADFMAAMATHQQMTRR